LEYVSQFIGDYVLQIGVALIVLSGATAAWITARRRHYVKFVEFKRGMDALRFEFRRSIDEARAATTKKATAVGDKLLSVIKPIDTNVTELHVRLVRLEERTDSVEASLARPQKNVWQDNEQIARLSRLEQRLTALTDQVSLIEEAIDGANLRHQERNNAIEVRLTSTEKQMADVFPRLELGERARADLGGLISLFVKQLKGVNITSTETAARVAKLESLHSKIAGLEERLSATPNDESNPAEFTTGQHADIRHASPSPGDEGSLIETNNGSAKGKTTSTQEPSNEPGLHVSSLSESSSAIEANGHGAFDDLSDDQLVRALRERLNPPPDADTRH
jgi:hypothetical protein